MRKIYTSSGIVIIIGAVIIDCSRYSFCPDGALA